MKNTLIVTASCAALLIAGNGLAKEHHGAHEHGKAKLDMAIDGKTINLQFESPAISFYGFEHEPKTDKQRKTVEAAVEKLKAGLSKMIVFEDKTGCKLEVPTIQPFVKEADEDDHDSKDAAKAPESKGGKKAEVAKGKEHHAEHGEHSELRFQAVAKCQNDPTGSTVTFNWEQDFPKLNSIVIQVVGDKTQGGGEVTKNKKSIKL